MADKKEMELLEALLSGTKSPEDLFGQDGLFKRLKKAAMEKMLEAELTEHLGYEKHDPAGNGSGNSRNGTTPKRLRMEDGEVELDIPRDRNGTFEPQLVRRHQRRLKGFDDQIVSMYARGMTVREIQGHVHDMYGVDIAPDLVSRITDGVLEDVRAWQARPLDPVYPIIYLDAFVVKVRDEGMVRNKSVYVALGINMQGRKDVLGLWIAQTEGAKFWMHVVTELRNRGVQDFFIACCDGLRGFPDAIEAVFPHTIVQTCIVHMVRNSVRLVSWQNRKALTRSLKTVYRAPTEEAALTALDTFEEEWGGRYPSIGKSWRDNWERVSPFFAFPADLRRAIYTTNPIEALNRQLRKVTKTRGAFPTDTSLMKLLWLAIERATRKWTYPIKHWDLVLQQLYILFDDRVPLGTYGR
jgi:putative transposase